MCANVCWVNVFLLTCVWAVPLEHSVPINVVAACFLSIRPTFVLRILLVQLLFALRNGLERDQNSYSLRYGSHLFTVRLSNFISKERERVERTIYIFEEEKTI